MSSRLDSAFLVRWDAHGQQLLDSDCPLLAKPMRQGEGSPASKADQIVFWASWPSLEGETY